MYVSFRFSGRKVRVLISDLRNEKTPCQGLSLLFVRKTKAVGFDG